MCIKQSVHVSHKRLRTCLCNASFMTCSWEFIAKETCTNERYGKTKTFLVTTHGKDKIYGERESYKETW